MVNLVLLLIFNVIGCGTISGTSTVNAGGSLTSSDISGDVSPVPFDSAGAELSSETSHPTNISPNITTARSKAIFFIIFPPSVFY